ncbi:MAG TPA: MFS transporter [Actinomycetota bacterium]|nr:MFS transporter [Actinomycetota bacterium]
MPFHGPHAPPKDVPLEPIRPQLLTPTFLVVGLATLAYFVADGMLLPAVPLYVEGPLGGGSVAVGVVVGAFSLSALLLRPWAGRLSDRRGRRLLMVAGAGVFAFSVLGYQLANSIVAMILMRALTGAGEALFFVGAASAISDLAPDERRGEALSFFSLALYAGIGVGPILGEATIDGADFSLVWMVAAGIGMVAVLFGLPVPDTRPEWSAAPGPNRLVHRAAILPGTVLLTVLIGMSGFFAFVPLYVEEIGLEGSRLVFVTLSVVVILIRSLGAKIPDRMGAARSSRAALACSAAGLLLAGAWGHPVGLFAGTIVFGVGVALATPALMSLAIGTAPPSERGWVIGTFTAFIDLGFGLGPVVLGVVATRLGYRGTFITGAAVAAAGLMLLLTRGSSERTHSPGGEGQAG